MNPLSETINRLLVSVLAGAALLTFGAGSAGAQIQVMLRVPDESGGAPAYALLEKTHVLHNEEWAAIVFWRKPDCVPPNFNLLDQLDLVMAINGKPRPFACPLTVSGFELWDKPGIDAPRTSVSSGSAVPVWFVRWTDLKAAVASGVLTKPKLESLSPLKGVAARYTEVFHPVIDVSQIDTGGGGLTINASGVLPDGRSFQFQFTDSFGQDAKYALGPGLQFVNIIIH